MTTESVAEADFVFVFSPSFYMDRIRKSWWQTHATGKLWLPVRPSWRVGFCVTGEWFHTSTLDWIPTAPVRSIHYSGVRVNPFRPARISTKRRIGQHNVTAIRFLDGHHVFGQSVDVHDVRRVDGVQDQVHDRNDVRQRLFLLSVDHRGRSGTAATTFVRSSPGRSYTPPRSTGRRRCF